MEGMATQHAFSKDFSRCANGEGLIDATCLWECCVLLVICDMAKVYSLWDKLHLMTFLCGKR